LWAHRIRKRRTSLVLLPDASAPRMSIVYDRHLMGVWTLLGFSKDQRLRGLAAELELQAKEVQDDP
jgi:hypothetical protein